MVLYNSASRQKEEFVPYEPGKVSMYTCGPTVYHFAHIGNLRSYLMEDSLNLLYGKVRQVPVSAVRSLVEEGAVLIDVREPAEYAAGHLKTAVNLPLSQLRERMGEIPADRPVYLHCRSSQRSYNALMALQNSGFNNIWNISGSFLGICLYEYYNDITQGREAIVTAYNFN